MTDLAPAPARLSIALDPFASARQLTEVPAGISPAEALSRNWPERWPHGMGLVLVRGGVVSEDWRGPLAPGETAMVAPRTRDPVSAIASVLQVASFGAIPAATATSLAMAISMAGFQYGLSRLMAPSMPRTPNTDTSRSFSFEGPETEYRTGGVIPVTFGRFVSGGTVLSYVVRNRSTNSELWLLLGLGEGPIAGVGGVSQELDAARGDSLPPLWWMNGNLLSTYGNRVRVWTRFGTTTQRAIPGFNNRERTYILNQKITQPTWERERDQVTYRTKNVVDAFEIGVGCPRGLLQTSSSGSITGRTLSFRMRYRLDTATTFGDWHRFDVNAKTADGFVVWKYFQPESAGRFVIELDRLTSQAEGFDPDDSTFEGVTEIEFRSFTYPGQVLAAIMIEAQEGLAGSRPRAKIGLDGLLCQVWDEVSEVNPAFDYVWTRNPFWIVLECLRNTEWGMGGHLRYVRYTLQEWADAAAWADELVEDELGATTTVAAAAGATTLKVEDTDGWRPDDVATLARGVTTEQVTVHEVLDSVTLRVKTAIGNTYAAGASLTRIQPRFQWDGTFDVGTSPWEAVQSILATCRGRIAKVGNRIKLIVARSRPVVGLISDGNGQDVSIVYRDHRHQPNHLIAEFLDEEDEWAPDTLASNADGAVLDEASLATYYEREDFRPHTVRMVGVTRRGQIRRELAWQLNVFRLAKKAARAVLPISGLVARLGEVIDVAHGALLDVSVSGRIAAALSSGGNTFTIDRPVVLAAATTYGVEIQYKSDEGVTNVVLRQIATAAGSYARGATLTITSTWPADVANRSAYAIGLLGEVAEPFEIVSQSLDPAKLVLGMELEQYVEALQDAD